MKRKKILIVENHAQSRRALRLVLESHDYEVVDVATTEEAGRLKGDSFDGAMLDMGTLQTEMKSFAAELAKKHPHIRIIFTSTTEEVDSWALPGSVLLIKPLQLDVLLELL